MTINNRHIYLTMYYVEALTHFSAETDTKDEELWSGYAFRMQDLNVRDAA